MRPVIAFLGWLLESYVVALRRRQAAAAGLPQADLDGLPPLSATTSDSAMLALMLRLLLRRQATRSLPHCCSPLSFACPASMCSPPVLWKPAPSLLRASAVERGIATLNCMRLLMCISVWHIGKGI